MRPQAHYPERQEVSQQDTRMTGIFMARVVTVDPATGLLDCELVDGSHIFRATCMALHAGSASGWLWLPEVEQLVVMAFLQGHKALPVVLGSLFADKDTPPTQAANEALLKHQSGSTLRIQENGDVIVTHNAGPLIRVQGDQISIQAEGASIELFPTGDIQVTHPNGSNIRVDETKVSINSDEGSIIEVDAGSGFIRLQHSTGNRIRVEELSIVIQDAAGNNITLDSDNGKVTVSVSGTIELGGTTAVVLDGDITTPGGSPSHTHNVIASSVKLKGG